MYEIIRTILSLFILFYENILSVKKHQNAKHNFPPLRVFVRKNLLPVLFFVSLILFCWFWFDFHFCAFKIFFVKKLKLKTDNLIHYTTGVYPYQPAYREFISTRLCSWQSAWFFYVLIFQNLFLPVRICFHLCSLSEFIFICTH